MDQKQIEEFERMMAEQKETETALREENRLLKRDVSSLRAALQRVYADGEVVVFESDIPLLSH